MSNCGLGPAFPYLRSAPCLACLPADRCCWRYHAPLRRQLPCWQTPPCRPASPPARKTSAQWTLPSPELFGARHSCWQAMRRPSCPPMQRLTICHLAARPGPRRCLHTTAETGDRHARCPHRNIELGTSHFALLNALMYTGFCWTSPISNWFCLSIPVPPCLPACLPYWMSVRRQLI
jgi:hypothetical protein